MMKLLMVFAGPHGSGKSTVFENAREEMRLPRIRINPDTFIAHKASGQARDALAEASRLRKAAFALGESFAFETISSLAVMRQAKALGYHIELSFFTTCDPEINKARVRRRVAEGGHNIPPNTIMAGYARSMSELAKAVSIADVARVYDNSLDRADCTDDPPLLVLHKPAAGDIWLIPPSDRPAWVDTYLVEPLQQSGDLPIEPDSSVQPISV